MLQDRTISCSSSSGSSSSCLQTKRSRRRRSRGAAALLLGAWLLAACCYSACVGAALGGADQPAAASAASHIGIGQRHLLWANGSCTPRSIETFPPDLFTLAQKQHGAIVLHIVAAVWLFAALAVVCDEFFVSSLEIICDTLSLKPDVAGATFMAAGSSAPELFTSVIGVFFAESDVGVSTIVGSAVFNILFIVSMCGLFATQVIYLTWWPIFRDCGFYALSVIALIIVIQNGIVNWYEAVIFIVLYCVYIALMYFNEKLDAKISATFPSLASGAQQQQQQQQQQPQAETNVDDERVAILAAGDAAARSHVATYSQLSLGSDKGDLQVQREEYESPFAIPQGFGKRLYWLVMLPWTCVFCLTIPDCRRPTGCWRRLYFLTFVTSIAWIAGMSYLLVWMVCAVGDTLGIPDTVMGLTLLAAGTSVPDALASVFVARDGLGDMAVSNSVGSNVFDILVGLGVPWLISTCIKAPGSEVTINSEGLTYSSVTLLSTVIFLMLAVYVNKMRLDRRLGVGCILVYILFISFAVMYETNVFGEFNPPPCPRTRF